MKKRHIISNLLFFMLLSTPGAYAQDMNDKNDEGTHPRSFEPSSFKNNWYIEAGGGVQMLFSDDASILDFKDRITPAVSLAIGKWFSPYWGIRLQAGGWSLHGYNDIKGNYIGDPLPGSDGTYGSDDPAKDHVDIHPDGTYRHYLRYANVHADFQVSMFNLIGGFNPDRRWDIIPAAGIGYTKIFNHKGTPSANVLSTHFSIMGKYRLLDRLDINIEAATSILPERFDGRISGDKSYAETLDLTLGVTWRLGKSKFKKLHCSYYDELKEAQETLARTRQQSDEWEAKAKARPKEIVKKEIKEVPIDNHFILGYIKFDSDNYTVNKKNHGAILAQVAEYLKNNKDANVILNGYADKKTGYPKYNLKMADLRTRNVADYLTKKHGIDSNRISIKNYGDTKQPYETNEWNRAVVVEIIYK